MTASSAGACQKAAFDQYSIISLVILLICIIYVRFVVLTVLHNVQYDLLFVYHVLLYCNRSLPSIVKGCGVD